VIATISSVCHSPHTTKQRVGLCHLNCEFVSRVVAAEFLCVLQMLDQKHLENFEMWCRRRTEISWPYRGRNEEVLHGVKEDRNYPTHNKRRKANWIGHILGRNCLLGHVLEER